MCPVLPSMPAIIAPRNLVENRNFTFICNAFVGRPTGVLQWFINVDDGIFQLLPHEQVEARLWHFSNGTSSAESHLHMNLTYSPAARLRCEVSSRAMRPWEKILATEVNMNILYPPRNGQILYNSTTKHYYCESAGNPRPTYIWMWVLKDGTKTILSTSSYLDLSPLQSTGIFEFHCLASNVVNNQRHTIVMKTKIKITELDNITSTSSSAIAIQDHIDAKTGNVMNEKSSYKDSISLRALYQIEGEENVVDFNMSHENEFPIWDIIHGYVGGKPISNNNNYNISQIAETLGDKYFPNASSNMQLKTSNSVGNFTKLINFEKEAITMLEETDKKHIFELSTDNSIWASVVTPQSFIKHTPELKSNVSKSYLFEMSPENYEYMDYNDGDKTKKQFFDLPINQQQKVKATVKVGEQVNTKLEKIDRKQSQATTKRVNNKYFTGYNFTLHNAVLPGTPKMPLITISELISGRYRKMRPTRSGMGKKKIVPWTKNGKVDFTKVLQKVPGHTKRLIVKKISKIKRNLHNFLEKYKHRIIKSTDAKKGQYGKIKDGDLFQYDDKKNWLIYDNTKFKNNFRSRQEQYSQHISEQDDKEIYTSMSSNHNMNLDLTSIHDSIYNEPFNQSFHGNILKNIQYNSQLYNKNKSDMLVNNIQLQNVVPTKSYQKELEKLNQSKFTLERNVLSKLQNVLDKNHHTPPYTENTHFRYIKTDETTALPSFYKLKLHSQFEKITMTNSEEFNCKSKTNGAYGGGCRAFYRCIDGKTHKVECINPFVFNERTQECDNAISVPSPCGDWKSCNTKPNGKYADVVRQCRFYYTCYQGVFLGHNKCNEGTRFNEDTQVCDWPQSVSCNQ